VVPSLTQSIRKPLPINGDNVNTVSRPRARGLRSIKARWGTERQSPAEQGKRLCRMRGGTIPDALKVNRNVWKHGGVEALNLEIA
jgi:hypothetical protein